MKNNRRSRKVVKIRAVRALLKMRSVSRCLTPDVRRAIWSGINRGDHVRFDYDIRDFGLTVVLTVKNGSTIMQPKLEGRVP